MNPQGLPDHVCSIVIHVPVEDVWSEITKTGSVQNTVVWLLPAGNNAAAKIPAAQIHPMYAKKADKPKVIDQPCCMFEPRVLALRDGEDYVVKNSAKIAHNVNVIASRRSGNKSFNVILPSGASKKIASVKAYRTPMNVRCDIHPWMQAYIWVFDSPYFAVTDEKGNFEFKNAPVGDYNIVVWHESMGYLGGRAGARGTPIKITEGGTDLGKIALKGENPGIAKKIQLKP